MANQQHYRLQFGDTTFTKVFVGGLAWETPSQHMRTYFEQFGEILEAVIITDKNTARSKGYGFVTFRDAESARRACVDPNPVIDGRRANCNIASMGRPRPSPPRGRGEGGNQYQGVIQSPTPYSRMVAPPPPPPPPPPLIYPSYGYATYAPEYGYRQSVYSPHVPVPPHYYHQMYATSSSAMGPAYPYGGYPGASFYGPQAHRIQVPPYVHYPTPGEAPTAGSQPYSFLPVVPTQQPGPTSDLRSSQQPSTSSGVNTEEASNN